jgi:hypothetical protein
MNAQPTNLERRLRRSGLLVGIGLVAELISLLWNHPTAFFLFLGVGAVLIAAGIFYYFYSLVAVSEHLTEAGPPPPQDLYRGVK